MARRRVWPTSLRAQRRDLVPKLHVGDGDHGSAASRRLSLHDLDATTECASGGRLVTGSRWPLRSKMVAISNSRCARSPRARAGQSGDFFGPHRDVASFLGMASVGRGPRALVSRPWPFGPHYGVYRELDRMGAPDIRGRRRTDHPGVARRTSASDCRLRPRGDPRSRIFAPRSG